MAKKAKGKRKSWQRKKEKHARRKARKLSEEFLSLKKLYAERLHKAWVLHGANVLASTPEEWRPVSRFYTSPEAYKAATVTEAMDNVLDRYGEDDPDGQVILSWLLEGNESVDGAFWLYSEALRHMREREDVDNPSEAVFYHHNPVVWSIFDNLRKVAFASDDTDTEEDHDDDAPAQEDSPQEGEAL